MSLANQPIRALAGRRPMPGRTIQVGAAHD
jgi:hypothetical protein